MKTIMDYLVTEFATFEEVPFCAVDALVLSEFCMVRMEKVMPPMREEKTLGGIAAARLRSVLASHRGLRFKDALLAEYYDEVFVGLVPHKIKDLMLALAASPRFRDMHMSECASVFDEKNNTQFAALSFSYKNKFAFVGFRGTDCSFTGWREDFDMAYMDRVPSQTGALRYLEAVACRLPKTLYVGGHSKGGNLAVYAAAKCDEKTRRRIRRVYCLDAPGFRSGMFSENERAAVVPLIERYVPRESLIGMLMKHSSSYTVVKSSASGAWQHDPFTWGIDGFEFETCDELSQSARFAHDVLNDWLARYDDEEARVIVDAMFSAMRASGAQDFAEIIQPGPRTLALLRDAAKNTDEKTRATLMDAIGDLAEVAARRAWYGQKR